MSESLFEQCPDHIFGYLGTFLALNEKVFRLPVLSRSISQSFNQCLTVLHSAVDIVYPPRLTDQRDFPPLNGHEISESFYIKSNSWRNRLPYVRYARSVTGRFNSILHCDQFISVESQFEAVLAQVETLDIEELTRTLPPLALNVLNRLIGDNAPITQMVENDMWAHLQSPSGRENVDLDGDCDMDNDSKQQLTDSAEPIIEDPSHENYITENHIFENPTVEDHITENHVTENHVIEPTEKMITFDLPNLPACDVFSRLKHLRLSWVCEDVVSEQFVRQLRCDGLSKCVNLQSLILQLPASAFHSPERDDASSSQQLLSALPSSLTRLSITSRVCLSEWKSSFESPDFLPHLENLSVGSVALAEVLSLPSNQGSHHAIRPLRSLCLSLADASQLSTFAQLTHLKLEIHPLRLDTFAHLADETMPVLNSLELSFNESEVSFQRFDLTEILCFMSKRPVTRFHVTSMYNDLVPLGERASRALSKLNSLEELAIVIYSGGSLFAPIKKVATTSDVESWEDQVDPSLDTWLHPGCLRHLRRLRIHGVSCDIDALLCLLSAAPGLNDADFEHSEVGIAILPLVASHCADIQRIKLRDMRRTSFDVLHQILEQFPIPVDSLQHLFVLDCQALLTPDALHFLCFHLRNAPHLAYFQDWLDVPKFETCCKWSLRHLRGLPHFDRLRDSNQRMLDVGDERRFLEPCCTAPLSSPFESINQSANQSLNRPNRLVLTEDEMLRDLFGANREYYRFRHGDDDGRRLFFMALFDELPGRDQQCLDEWDHAASELIERNQRPQQNVL